MYYIGVKNYYTFVRLHHARSHKIGPCFWERAHTPLLVPVPRLVSITYLMSIVGMCLLDMLDPTLNFSMLLFVDYSLTIPGVPLKTLLMIIM